MIKKTSKLEMLFWCCMALVISFIAYQVPKAIEAEAEAYDYRMSKFELSLEKEF